MSANIQATHAPAASDEAEDAYDEEYDEGMEDDDDDDDETDEEDYEDYYDESDESMGYEEEDYDDDDGSDSSAGEDDGVIHFPTSERVVPAYQSNGEEYPDSGSESRPYTDEDSRREEADILDEPSHRIEPPFTIHPLQRRCTLRSTEIISSLTPEILDLIFAFYQVRRWKYGFVPAREFCALTRVNKHWRPWAEERLYYRVSVDKPRRARKLVRTLSEAPHLASLVRELRLGMLEIQKVETLNHTRALLLCPNLHRIDLSGWNGYALPGLLRALKEQKDVHDLRVTRYTLRDNEGDCLCQDWEILAMIQSWPNFKRLWVGNHVFGYESRYTTRVLRKKLEAMGVECWGPGSGKRI